MGLSNIQGRGISGAGRRTTYVVLALILAIAAPLVARLAWQIDSAIHTQLELVATVMAFVIGALAVVRYRAGRGQRYFFIGLGLAGTAVLDAYHLLATAQPATELSTSFDLLLPWSWLTSRTLLAILLALSAYEDRRISRQDVAETLNESRTVIIVALSTLATFFVFTFLPLPTVYFPNAFFSRPMDLFPALFFVPALIWLYQSNAWREDVFKHWLLLALIVNSAMHIFYMPFSASIGDAMFSGAHVLKIAGYGLIFVGLAAGLARLVRDVEQTADKLQAANAALTQQIADREAAEHQVRLLADLVENISIGVSVLRLEDPDDLGTFRILTANPAVEKIAGRPAPEMIGHTLGEIYPGSVESGLPALYRDILREGKLRDLGEVNYEGDGISGIFSILALPLDEATIGVVVSDVTKRKRAELALRHREEQLVEAQRLAHLGSWDWDLTTNEVIWSDEMYRIFGYEPQSVAITPDFYFDHVHEEDRASIRAAVEYALANHIPFANYPRIVRRDDKVRVLHAQGNIELDEHGHPLRMWGTAQDITERRAAEERLRQSELRLAQAQRLANVGHWDWDVATGTVTLSDQLARILGRDPTDSPMDFAAYMALVHPDDRTKLQDAIAEAQANLSQFNVQFRLIREDGAERILHAIGNVIADENRRSLRLWGTGQDITEQQKVLDAVRESEIKFRLVAQSANDAVISADSDGNVIFWNEAASRIFGYTAEEIDGRPLTMIMPEDYREMHRQGMARVQAGGDFRVVGKTVELHGLRRDGAVFPLELSLAAWEDSGERYFTGILRDITERQAAAEERAAFTARLEESNRELEEFAYIASHDLQEPLRKIRAFGDRLRRKYGDALDETGRDYLERMESAAGRMQALIDDLLALSRVTTRGQPFQPVNLNETVAEVVSDLEVAIERVDGDVLVDELPTVEADPSQMRQLFQNLISNGLKFHRPEVPPLVRIYSRETERDSGRQCIEICIEDNGIGFDEKYLDRIFQPFQRLHGRQKFEGTGIGLAICRKIAQRHGGNVTATSRPGQGTTFKVTLPHRAKSGEGNP